MTLSAIAPYLWPRRHANLIFQFVRRDIEGRYRASMLGVAWAVLIPLAMVTVYTFIFRHVFKARWGSSDGGSDLEFALFLYTGLAVFNFFAECVTRAPGLVLAHPNLVKRVVFPLEVLPWVSALAAGFHLAIALVLLLVGAALLRGGLPLTVLALPAVWLPLLPLALGLGWLLAALGVFVRDIGQVLAVAISLLMFLCPVFYPLSALPEQWRPVLALNPLATIIEGTRSVLLENQLPDWGALALQLTACLAIALAGAAFFRATRHGFADVV
jgi:lipopolysaccharide transport system permease protein